MGLKSFLVYLFCWLVSLGAIGAWCIVTWEQNFIPLTFAPFFLVFLDRNFRETFRAKPSDYYRGCHRCHSDPMPLLLLLAMFFCLPWYLARILRSLFLHGRLSAPAAKARLDHSFERPNYTRFK